MAHRSSIPPGNPIPTYSNNDVMGLAKVFTGFSWNVPGNTSDTAWSNCCIYVGTGYGEDLLPMQAYPNHHSTDEKDFLGVTIPASGSPDPNGDLKIALDTLFQSSEPAGVLLEAVDSTSGDVQSQPRICGPSCRGFQRQRPGCSRRHEGRDHRNSSRP